MIFFGWQDPAGFGATLPCVGGLCWPLKTGGKFEQK